MSVKITVLTRRGHEELSLSREEAQQLIEAERGNYYIVDAGSRELLHEVVVEDGRELLLIPIAEGG